MKSVIFCAALLSASLLCGSCQRSAIKSSQSLAGATELPSAKVLSREIIQINRGFGSLHPGLLSYELRPDDTLVVTFTSHDWKTVLSKQSFRLSSKDAAVSRRMLWRVRPQELKGIAFEVRPPDCPPPPTDSPAEISVVFFAGDHQPLEDDRIGIFWLPYADTCRTPQATEARGLLNRVLQSFPRSKVAVEYERQDSELQAKLRS